jgi:hypothetical protein
MQLGDTGALSIFAYVEGNGEHVCSDLWDLKWECQDEACWFRAEGLQVTVAGEAGRVVRRWTSQVIRLK